jgi:hypothetical protein
MSYLCLLCLFAYSGVQHILCCAFIVFLRVENPMLLVSLDQGSHYFQIGGRSDFSFRELTLQDTRHVTHIYSQVRVTQIYSQVR